MSFKRPGVISEDIWRIYKKACSRVQAAVRNKGDQQIQILFEIVQTLLQPYILDFHVFPRFIKLLLPFPVLSGVDEDICTVLHNTTAGWEIPSFLQIWREAILRKILMLWWTTVCVYLHKVYWVWWPTNSAHMSAASFFKVLFALRKNTAPTKAVSVWQKFASFTRYRQEFTQTEEEGGRN